MADDAVHTISMDMYRLSDLRRVLEERPRIELSPDVQANIERGARFLRKKVDEGQQIYGVNTGFGALCEVRVDDNDLELLQYNHVVSHAAGVGDAAESDIVRLMMFLKLLTFRSGHSGITVGTTQRLIDFLNENVVPVVPHKGTLGASGDLAPLSHMAIGLMGMGEVRHNDRRRPAMDVLEEFDWKPIKLGLKEGLALTNGVQYINAYGAAALLRAERLIVAADVISAMSGQAFSVSKTFYDPLYHSTCYHRERGLVARNLMKLIEESNHYCLSTSTRSKQDPYSFRCIPQVHAAVRQGYGFAKNVIEQECNSVSDNPQVFCEEDVILFGGALHGESAALAMDTMALSIAELGSISECRSYQLLSGNRGLPDFLSVKPGVNSGLMVAQYTASALVNENKIYATPAVVDTRPSCQLQEDHVSMGGTSAYKLWSMLSNVEYILAIELLLATQAIELNKELKLSRPTREVYESFRERVAFIDVDRVLQPDIEESREFILKHSSAWQSRFQLA